MACSNIHLWPDLHLRCSAMSQVKGTCCIRLVPQSEGQRWSALPDTLQPAAGTALARLDSRDSCLDVPAQQIAHIYKGVFTHRMAMQSLML